MEIKYEAVFGDQLLFGDDRSNATVVVSFDDGAKVFIDPDKYRVATPLFGYNGSFSIAMRRIIRTPEISGDIDDLIKDEFYEWWKKEGCLVRSGGGDYERTFAFAAFRKLMPEILAARGLKKTPTWTVADQKEGKLPEGYRLMPPEPTPEMIKAWRESPFSDDHEENLASGYDAMFFAAPEQNK